MTDSFNEPITFYDVEQIETDEGIPTEGETNVLEVFCMVKSIGQNEFYKARETGLTPDCKVVLASHMDYDGQHYARYQDRVYRIMRTYINPENGQMEITLEVK